MRFLTYTQSMHTSPQKQNIGFVRVVSLIFTVCVLFSTLHPVASAQIVHIPDPNLRTVLESALGKEAGSDITQADMASLESLMAVEAGIRNLTGLEFATNLTKLHLGLNRISDLSALQDLTNLIELDLHRNTLISDVSPLKNLTNLKHLSLRGNVISNMSAFTDLTMLTYLHIGYNRIADLSPLKVLTNLTFLNLDHNHISDLSPLTHLTNLTELHLDDNRILDMSSLKVLTNLTFLNINDNNISDLSPLTHLTNLTSLNLHGTGTSDVSLLKNLTALRVLRLHENQIRDLSPLKDLTDLRVLTLHENQVMDLLPLKDLTELTKLDLHSNAISDVSPLKNLINLTTLDLSDNHISDFSPLAELTGNLKKYDFSNQTSDQITPVIKPEDVNRDGIVDVTDLTLVAINYRNPNFANVANSNIYPDINSDGIVDISDLLAVAAEINTEVAAPVRSEKPIEIPDLSAEKLTQWIQRAKQLNTQQPHIQKGITALEQLLAALTFAAVAPKETALLANYPNPFNPETWIPYQLAEPAAVSISIYAADGKLVRTLALGHLPAGIYHSKSRAAYWDGRNPLGESVASGIYFYTFTANDFTATRKMIIRK